MKPLKQLIPSEVCLRCQVCCRFPIPESEMYPRFMKEEVNRLSPKHQSFFGPSYGEALRNLSTETTFRPSAEPCHGTEGQQCACPFFNPGTQECAIYPDRPLDCQLYPFVLTLSPTRKRVLLSLDTQCPFVQDPSKREALIGYGEVVRHFLEEKEVVEAMAGSPGLIGEGDVAVLPLYPLGGLTEKRFHATLFGDPPPPSLGLSSLTLKDRDLIETCLSSSPREFAEEALLPFFVFSDLLRFYWKKEGAVLFIIAEQGGHFFMPIPPVAKKQTTECLKEGFDLLGRLNRKGTVSRIEGLSEERCHLAEPLGCSLYPKPPEYLYRRSDLATLTGGSYKSKRALCNYFTKNYHSSYEPYQKEDFWGCLHLFKRWQDQRAMKLTDPYELALLEDAAFVHRQTLLHAEALKGEGRVVKVGGEIKGYTFGYALNDETWCILLEIADPQVKGLSQFLFREFCSDKIGFTFISAMDDSGLERLRQVKESYRPALKKTPYVAARRQL